jgi:molybdate transport system regulatory protein
MIDQTHSKNVEELRMIELFVSFKFWFEAENKYAFGEGAFKLLEAISKSHSLMKAADSTNMSYRYAWGIIRKIEETIKTPVVTSYRGGKHGGGRSELTEKGRFLLQTYKRVKTDFENLSEKHSQHLQENMM